MDHGFTVDRESGERMAMGMRCAGVWIVVSGKGQGARSAPEAKFDKQWRMVNW